MSSAIELAHVVVEPSRLIIIRSLMEGPKYISKIAEKTNIDRATVSYHLGVLEQNELVRSEYQILREPKSKGKAARVYKINTKMLSRALGEIDKVLPQIRPKED